MGNDLPRIWAYVQSGFIIATPEKRDEIRRTFENSFQGPQETIAQFATRLITLNAQFMVLNNGVGFDERDRVKFLVSNANNHFSTMRIIIKDKIETLEMAEQHQAENGEDNVMPFYTWDQALRSLEKFEQDELPKLKKSGIKAEPKNSVDEKHEDNVMLTRKEWEKRGQKDAKKFSAPNRLAPVENKPNGNYNSNTQARGICFHYQRGNCNRGSRCRFIHSSAPSESKDNSNNQRHCQNCNQSTHWTSQCRYISRNNNVAAVSIPISSMSNPNSLSGIQQGNNSVGPNRFHQNSALIVRTFQDYALTRGADNYSQNYSRSEG